VNRDDEIAAIERFVMERGATTCPAICAAPTSSGFSVAEEARRLETTVVRKRTREEMRAAARRFYLTIRL